MRLKIILRLSFFVLLGLVKILFGMDWTIITAAVVIVADLDSIVDALERKCKK